MTSGKVHFCPVAQTDKFCTAIWEFNLDLPKDRIWNYTKKHIKAMDKKFWHVLEMVI